MNKQIKTKQPPLFVKHADKVADLLNADVLLINAPIERGLDEKIINDVLKRNRRSNIFFILITPGGDADTSYRIARCLQDSYERVVAFISGYCKSAGTLCILGANEIVMSDIGELGPLDVQLYKKDELFELSSGLVATEALLALQHKAFEMFEEYFMLIKFKSDGQITFKTATEIAVKLCVGLMEPLYKQIDPIQVGETARSMKIAKDYGKRLMIKSKNFNMKTLDTLIETYPTHGFVIDKSEVENLFKNVRGPSEEEGILIEELGALGTSPEQKQYVNFLSTEIKGEENEKGTDSSKQFVIGETNKRSGSSRTTKNSG